eukprot:gene17407-19995_t
MLKREVQRKRVDFSSCFTINSPYGFAFDRESYTRRSHNHSASMLPKKPLAQMCVGLSTHDRKTVCGGSTDTPTDTLHKEVQAAFKVLMTR